MEFLSYLLSWKPARLQTRGRCFFAKLHPVIKTYCNNKVGEYSTEVSKYLFYKKDTINSPQLALALTELVPLHILPIDLNCFLTLYLSTSTNVLYLMYHLQLTLLPHTFVKYNVQLWHQMTLMIWIDLSIFYTFPVHGNNCQLIR